MDQTAYEEFGTPLLFSDLQKLWNQSARKPPRHRSGERFIKGPLPLAWIKAAALQPYQALYVGLLLWHEAGWRKSCSIPFKLSQVRETGISRDTVRRSLKALEQAGLIYIERPSGRSLQITLLDASENESDEP
jgi:DNA-binding transcriptional ArsR family regulator